MAHTRGRSIAIIREGPDDDRDSTGRISLIVDFFDLGPLLLESRPPTDGTFDDISRDSRSLRSRDGICEEVIRIGI